MVTTKKGFSLMELLVVIALIAILTAIAAVSYSSMQKKARDSRRVSDMKSIQVAFEQYYGDNNAYPASCASPGVTYLPDGLPDDPKNTGTYVYTSRNCSTAGYCFCATLESGSGNSGNIGCVSGSAGIYCVKQSQ